MTRSIASRTSARRATESVRTVPPILAEPGITLRAVPAARVVTDTTTESNGSVSRATICCRLVITWAATTTGSTVSCGFAPWPP